METPRVRGGCRVINQHTAQGVIQSTVLEVDGRALDGEDVGRWFDAACNYYWAPGEDGRPRMFSEERPLKFEFGTPPHMWTLLVLFVLLVVAGIAGVVRWLLGGSWLWALPMVPVLVILAIGGAGLWWALKHGHEGEMWG